MTDTLALFDLDNTLLPIDSDYEWGQFLVKIGAVDKESYEKKMPNSLRNTKPEHLIRLNFLLSHWARWRDFPVCN